jgi:copper(I)-binding protein
MRISLLARVAVALSYFVFSAVFAQQYQVGTLHVVHPWTRATPAAGIPGAGFLEIVNTGKEDDRLLDCRSVIADLVEIHSTSMQGGVDRMRPMPNGLPLPAGAKTVLAPSGTHLMLIGLKHALAVGEKVPIELHFAKAGAITVDFVVESSATDDGMKSMGSMN